MNQYALYEIAYALAARDGREAALFGDCASAAREAFSRSLACAVLPELWFELPLTGEPWFDLHALVSYEDVAGTEAAFSGQGGVYAQALSWFAAQKPYTVRQLALSYDTSSGDVEHPAVQLLVSRRDDSVPLEFLEAIGRSDAKDSYSTFVRNMPQEWYPCYVGAFPARHAPGTPSWIRVECLLDNELQRVYANDGAVLREHLARVGLRSIDDAAIGAIQAYARTSFPLELQFNVGEDGTALPVISASVRFQSDDWMDGSRLAEIERLASWMQNEGLADGRWRQIGGTLFAKSVKRDGEYVKIMCFPAFVKLRWREGQPMDAKAYLLVETRKG